MDLLYEKLQELTIWLPPFLLALTFHELAHGYVAYRLGDPTAKNAGRLTMNPVKHIDPLGALVFIFAHVGWAKPVPVNPVNFRDPQKGMLWVSLAGPGANILLAIISLPVFMLITHMSMLPLSILKPLVQMVAASVWINIALAIFNCLPIPPLDGSKVLMSLLPPQQAYAFSKFETYGFLAILLLSYTGVLSHIIVPVINFSNNLLWSLSRL
ncbi:site-2 protease family protein [Desulfogranum japonicum]|uniref:site-2 protease family protein n=1 Tax=Desulfogranum japonicum TaxID=231447 RepID=UPI0004163E9B|nr:site-2 protease family protein [Desulfogranum japonicum]